MKKINSLIDMSFSIDDWIALIRELLETIQKFFKELGLDFFGENTTTEVVSE